MTHIVNAWDYIPGVPAAGHVTTRGYWHPGAAANCSKAGCDNDHENDNRNRNIKE